MSIESLLACTAVTDAGFPAAAWVQKVTGVCLRAPLTSRRLPLAAPHTGTSSLDQLWRIMR